MQSGKKEGNNLWEYTFNSSIESTNIEKTFQETFQNNIIPQLYLRNMTKEDAFNWLRNVMNTVVIRSKNSIHNNMEEIPDISQSPEATINLNCALKNLEELFVKKDILDIMSIYNNLKYIVNRFELNNRIVLNIVNNWNSDLIKNSLYKLVEIDKISKNHQYNKELRNS